MNDAVHLCRADLVTLRERANLPSEVMIDPDDEHVLTAKLCRLDLLALERVHVALFRRMKGGSCP